MTQGFLCNPRISHGTFGLLVQFRCIDALCPLLENFLHQWSVRRPGRTVLEMVERFVRSDTISIFDVFVPIARV